MVWLWYRSVGEQHNGSENDHTLIHVTRWTWCYKGLCGRVNTAKYNNNNNNNNNNCLLQSGCYPVAVVILHVNKT